MGDIRYFIVFDDDSAMTARVRNPEEVPEERVVGRFRVVGQRDGVLALSDGERVELPVSESGLAKEITESMY